MPKEYEIPIQPPDDGISDRHHGPAPDCFYCKHRIGDESRCKAYPDGIPPEIWFEGVKHIKKN